MRLRHLAGAALLALTVGAAVPHASAQYPPTVANGRVTRSEMKQCQCTQFSGDGFAPGTTVTVYDKGPDGIERVVGSVTTDGKGEFKLKVCFDETSSQGEHTLIGRGDQPDGGAREVRATVTVSGTVCFARGDEVHNPNAIAGVDEESPREDTGSGPDVGGVGLPRTGADYVVPGLLLGFVLVLTGTGVVHLTRRRRLVTG